MSNAKATTTALKSASTAKKKRKQKVMTKVQRTQNMLVKALAKVEGDYTKLDRQKMLGTIQKTLKMKEANQASTYYHNALRAHQSGDESKQVIIKLR